MNQNTLSRLSRKKLYSRLQERSPKIYLLRKLLEEYGYERSPKIAEVLVDDILSSLAKVMPEKDSLKPGQMMILAVPINLKGGVFGRPISKTDLTPVKVTVLSEEDIKNLIGGLSYDEWQKRRIKRVLREVHKQGATLTQTELQVVLGLRLGQVQRLLKEIEKEEQTLLPTRGVVHDLGRSTSHKTQIVSLTEKGLLTPEIARRTGHDMKSINRYLKDYNKVKILAKETSFTEEEIANLTSLSPSLVKQYLEIVKDQT